MQCNIIVLSGWVLCTWDALDVIVFTLFINLTSGEKHCQALQVRDYWHVFCGGDRQCGSVPS